MIHIFIFQEEPNVNEGKFSRRGVLRAGLLAVTATGTLGLAGCGGGEDGMDDPQLRFVNATVDFSPADFWVDNRRGPTVQAGGGFTNYGLVRDGMRPIGVGPSGQNAQVTISRNFAKESFTTAVALMGASGNEEFRFLDEDNALPPGGSVKLRVLNATSATGYDIYVQSVVPATGNTHIVAAGYNNLTEFTNFASGTRRVYITNRNSLAVIFRSAEFTFPSRTVGTLVIVPNGSGIAVVALQEQGNGARLTHQAP